MKKGTIFTFFTELQDSFLSLFIQGVTGCHSLRCVIISVILSGIGYVFLKQSLGIFKKWKGLK